MSAYARHSDRIFGMVEKFLGHFLVFLIAAMVIDVSWQVVARFALGNPSSFTEELARFLMIWIGILGAAYAFRRGSHLGLDLLTEKLEGKAKRNTSVAANLCCLAFAATVMTYGGSKLVLLMLELDQTSSALGVKWGYVYIAVPLSGLLISLFSLDNMFHPERDGPSADAPPMDAVEVEQ